MHSEFFNLEPSSGETGWCLPYAGETFKRECDLDELGLLARCPEERDAKGQAIGGVEASGKGEDWKTSQSCHQECIALCWSEECIQLVVLEKLQQAIAILLSHNPLRQQVELAVLPGS